MTSLSSINPRSAGELFVSLWDSVVDQPKLFVYFAGVHWQILPLGSLYGSFYNVPADESHDLLVTLQERWGGVVTATRETHSSGSRWHQLVTVLDGVTVTLRVPVPQASVEQALRDRIAELEATSPAGPCGRERSTGLPCPTHGAAPEVADVGTGHGSYEYRSGA